MKDHLYQKIICMDQKNLKILRLISIYKNRCYFSTKINKIDFNKKLIYDQNDNNYSYDKLVFAMGLALKVEEILKE